MRREFLVRKHEGQRQLGRPTRKWEHDIKMYLKWKHDIKMYLKWEHDIKMYLKEILSDVVKLIDLAQDRNK